MMVTISGKRLLQPIGAPGGDRTRVSEMRTQRPRPLNDRSLVRATGIEPAISEMKTRRPRPLDCARTCV